MHECFREAEMDEREEIKSQERHHGDVDIEDLFTQCYLNHFS